MIITINGKTRNHIFLVVFVATVFCLIAAFAMKTEDDKVNLDNYIHYQQALKLMNQKKYVQAQDMFELLDESYLQTYQVQQDLGLCSAALGKYTDAAKFMNQVQKIRPAQVTDQEYLELYGGIFYHLGQYEKARLYLTESIKYNDKPQLKQNAQKILQQMENK